jgi:hypothetical protein
MAAQGLIEANAEVGMRLRHALLQPRILRG